MKYYRISKLLKKYQNWAFIITYLYNLNNPFYSLIHQNSLSIESSKCNIRNNQSPFFFSRVWSRTKRKEIFRCIFIQFLSWYNQIRSRYVYDKKMTPLCFASEEIGYHVTFSQINEDLMAGRPWGILDTPEAKFTSSCDDLYSNLTYQPPRLVSSHTLRFIDAHASFEERLRSRLFSGK